MIHVATVDLAQHNVVFPTEQVRMVIAQPYVPLESLTATEPFRCTEQAKPHRLAILTETLNVSRGAGHQASKTHFTVFPEYSIPGLDGIALIDNALASNDWPAATVVIGGTDALERTQYVELLQAPHTHVDIDRNGADQVPANCWLNCAITWVKTANGTIERWIQPKLHPAWTEQNVHHQQMFRGGSVYVFKGLLQNGAPFRFSTLVCFDWIATISARTPSQWILADVHEQADGGQLPISWLFVIQRNEKPSHDSFLSVVTSFFNQTEFPNATRHNACLIFSNTAGKPKPGRTGSFGGCSIVLSPQSLFQKPNSVPTFSDGGARFRDGSNLLLAYKDFYFRERGACIHSFAQINPGSVAPGPAGRTYAVDDAQVWPISGTREPRAPAEPVPAPIKWINDELDGLPSLSAAYGTANLAVQADNAHAHNVGAFRSLSSQLTTHAITLAVQRNCPIDNADEWHSTESRALKHVVHTLDILTVGFASPSFGTPRAHAKIQIDDQTVDICAVRGVSHEHCIEHSKRVPPNPHRQLLLVSRDSDNTPWDPKLGSILEPTAVRLGQDNNITDPSASLLHVGYQDLLTIFRGADTTGEVSDGIKNLLPG